MECRHRSATTAATNASGGGNLQACVGLGRRASGRTAIGIVALDSPDSPNGTADDAAMRASCMQTGSACRCSPPPPLRIQTSQPVNVSTELTLRDGDKLGLDPLTGELIVVPPDTASGGGAADKDTPADSNSKGGQKPRSLDEQFAEQAPAAVASVRFHGSRFWIHEEVVAATATEDDGSSSTLRIRAPAGAGLPLRVGSCFSFGGSTFRLMRVPPDSRAPIESWEGLAIGLYRARAKAKGSQAASSEPHALVMMPPWDALAGGRKAGTIGRSNNKKAALPLPDLAAKRRHAVFRLEGFAKSSSRSSNDVDEIGNGDGGSTNSLLRAGQLWLKPWKGSRVSSCLAATIILGIIRGGFILATSSVLAMRAYALCRRQGSRRLFRKGGRCKAKQQNGNGNGNGHEQQSPFVIYEDLGKRYRRGEMKNKKRLKKLGLAESSSSDSGDEDAKISVEELEREVGPAEVAQLKLEIVQGPGRGRVHTASAKVEGVVSIGSGVHASMRLEADLTVEEVHAVIRHGTDGEWYLSDCGSKSGTSLLLADGGFQLDVGDVVTIGNTELGMYVKRRG